MPFDIDSIEKIILKEEDELRSLIYEEVEDNLDFEANIEVGVEILARFPDNHYGDDEFEHKT